VQETWRYLNKLVPPVLKCFGDQDSRVRYYACEAMYNISKVARGRTLTFFNEIFEGLCRVCTTSPLLLLDLSAAPLSLTFFGGPGVVVCVDAQLSADKDLNVKNGAQLLDRLIKDIVTESDAFDIERLSHTHNTHHTTLISRVASSFLTLSLLRPASCHCSRSESK